DRPRNLERFGHRRKLEGQSIACGLVAEGSFLRRRLRGQDLLLRLEEVFRPARAGERPFVFGAQYEFFAGVTYVEGNARLLVPAGVFAFQKMAEEAALQRVAVTAVEMGEMRVTVHLEPFLLGAGLLPAFEIAAGVQADATPVSGRKQRGLDLCRIGGMGCIII